MSLIELILSRKEVLFSLALVVFILIVALLLAVAPTIRRKWKRAMMQRKANRAAKLARLRKQQSMNRRRQQMMREAEVEAVAEELPVEPVEPVTVEALPAGVVPPAEDPDTVGGEALSPEEAAEAALTGIFDGEFVDDEAEQRLAVLLKGVEPVSAEALANLANSIEAQLTGKQPKRDDR